MRMALGMGLQRAVVGLPGADADDALDVSYEDLAVSDFARLGGLHDRLDDLIDQIAAHRDLDARLRNEVDHVFRAAIELGVPALAPEAFHLGDRHARHTDVREGGAYVVELEGLDDRCDEFHERRLRLRELPAWMIFAVSMPCRRMAVEALPAARLRVVPAGGACGRCWGGAR